MECDLNGFQSIRYVNGHFDILYSYDVSLLVLCCSLFRRETLVILMIANILCADDEVITGLGQVRLIIAVITNVNYVSVNLFRVVTL